MMENLEKTIWKDRQEIFLTPFYVALGTTLDWSIMDLLQDDEDLVFQDKLTFSSKSLHRLF